MSTNRQKPAQLAEECFRSLLMGARRTPCSFPTESLRISSQMLGSTEKEESARTKAASLLPGPVNKCFHLLLPMSLTRLYSKRSACGTGLLWIWLLISLWLAQTHCAKGPDPGVFSALASSAIKKGRMLAHYYTGNCQEGGFFKTGMLASRVF